MIESLSQLTTLMTSYGVTQLYAKRLSPNDNSKNQIYLGGNFTSLNIIPNKGVYTDSKNMGSKNDRYKADISFSWVDEHGLYIAPKAQLILYPKYPEVRMSGFLTGCTNAPSELMKSREEGRILFMGITGAGDIIGYVVDKDSYLKKELDARSGLNLNGVFIEVPIDTQTDSKLILLDKLRKIHELHWIKSCKLNKDGSRAPCNVAHCGGYTLEAELGVTPNGYSEPDFLGWEVKSYSVKNFSNPNSGKPVTLMTPEPTSGIYRDRGVEEFMRRFGYPDISGIPDRINFGGPYRCGIKYARTGLTLVINGYNASSGKIKDLSGGISLITDDDEVAATWKFSDMMTHWNRKHAKAVYVPSMCMLQPERQYCYGNIIQVGEGTDFYRLLSAIANGSVYYDPGIKLENASSSKPAIKRRSQFRIKLSNLGDLYHSFEKTKLT